MVGTLSGIQAVGSGVSPQIVGDGTLSAQLGTVEYRQPGLNGRGTLTAVRVPAYLRGAPLAGTGQLDPQTAQVYDIPRALAGAGILAAPVYGVAYPALNLSGAGVLAGAATGLIPRTAAFSGDGAYSPEVSAVEPRVAACSGGGALSADLLPTTQVVARVDENIAAVTQALPYGSNTAGVYVTLIGAGGGGGSGRYSDYTSALSGGGGGGGGAAIIKRTFIPATSLGSTYSTTIGAGGTGALNVTATTPTNGSAGKAGGLSSFASGSLAMTANGGGAGGAGTTAAGAAGAAGTASVSGGTASLANGTAGGAGSGGNGNGSAAPNNANQAPAGGGGGGGLSSGQVLWYGGKGGSVTGISTGGAGGVTSTVAGNGPAAVAGTPGSGGGGGSGGNNGTRDICTGGHGVGYGAGGGGGGGKDAQGTCVNTGGNGGPGYSKLEWVASMVITLLDGGGTLSGARTPQYQRTAALSGTGALTATAKAVGAQLVGTNAAAGRATVAIPAHIKDDLLVLYQLLTSGSQTSVAKDWIHLYDTHLNLYWAVYFQYAKGPGTTLVASQWMDSTVAMVAEVWRNAQPGGYYLGTGGSTVGASTTTITYPALDRLTRVDAAAWVVRVGAHETATNLLATTPPGFVPSTSLSNYLRTMNTGAAVSSNPAAGTQSVSTSASGDWETVSLEILPKGRAWVIPGQFADPKSSTRSPQVKCWDNANFPNADRYYSAKADDIIVAWCWRWATGQTITPPAGWASVLGGATDLETSTWQMCCLYHVVTAAEEAAGTSNWTLTNLYATSVATNVGAYIIRGADTANPIDAVATGFNNSDVNPHIIPGIPGANLSSGSVVVSGISSENFEDYGIKNKPSGPWLRYTSTVGTLELSQQIALCTYALPTTQGVDVPSSTISLDTTGTPILAPYAAITVAFNAAP
jgi:hypothetical protein